MIKLSLQDLDAGTRMDRERLRDEFSRFHCVLLPGFLDVRMGERIAKLVSSGGFYTREDFTRDGGVLARENALEASHPLATLMFILLNQPKLFEWVQEITGVGDRIRFFRSRVAEFKPRPEHYDSWHDDVCQGQLIGMSINLGQEPYERGEFEIRDAETQEVYRRIEKTRFGDAHLFRIKLGLEHRVQSVAGSHSRLSCAGWFCSRPDYRVVLKGMLASGAPTTVLKPHSASG